jgi:hypothetical protein
MELESVGFTNERAKEMVNVTYLMKKLVKDPKRPLRNCILTTVVIYILAILILIGVSICGYMWRSPIYFICAGLYFAIVLIYTARIIYMIKMLKTYRSMPTDRKTVLEEDGVNLTINGVSDTKFYWTSFSIMRVFEHNIVFIPKDINTLSLSMPIQHLDKVKQYMHEHNVDIEICE